MVEKKEGESLVKKSKRELVLLYNSRRGIIAYQAQALVERDVKMTSSDTLKCVVSFGGSMPRKPLYLNCSVLRKCELLILEGECLKLGNFKMHPFVRKPKNLMCAGHVSQEAVKRYINEQEGKDVFEYNVFGSPNQKIGNFTGQKKLREWS